MGIKAERKGEKEVEGACSSNGPRGEGILSMPNYAPCEKAASRGAPVDSGWIGQTRRDSTELPARVRQHEQGSQFGDGFHLQPLLENHTIGSSFPEDLQNAAGPTNPHPPMTFGGRSGGYRATGLDTQVINRKSAGTQSRG